MNDATAVPKLTPISSEVSHEGPRSREGLNSRRISPGTRRDGSSAGTSRAGGTSSGTSPASIGGAPPRRATSSTAPATIRFSAAAAINVPRSPPMFNSQNPAARTPNAAPRLLAK